jgi:Na+-transporting methylmalonyl-CoA/oxaloacetate decarboxylase gamma subunit|tara:strand:+ start:139 stop:252 length:114 start_codon:yes stop_codon:yes gene_type:complete
MIEQILLGLILVVLIFIAIMLYAIGEQIAQCIKEKNE